MKTIKHQLNERASLTCYIQDLSPELPQMNKRHAALICPGGAYKTCSDREAEPVALAYLAKGYNAFVLRYTVTGHDDSFPADQVFACAIAEAEESLAYIRANAEEFHINSQEIAAVGFSASANLAAALGTLSKQKPNALVLGYPSVDSAINDSLQIKCPTMIDHVTKDTPPTFLFTTQGDTIVPSSNSLRFALALYENHVPYEIHVFATGDHGLSLAEPYTGNNENDVKQWFHLSTSFLDHIWSKKPLLWQTSDNEVLSADTRLDRLMADDAAKQILQKHIPAFMGFLTSNTMVNGVSLRRIAMMSQGKLSSEAVEAIDQDLKKLSK